MRRAEALKIYAALRMVGAAILKAYGCDTEPHSPYPRTKRWLHGKPRGLGLHYTAGSSTIGAMKWGNKAAWGNTGSSWHVLVADRFFDSKLCELWIKLASPEIRALFPVPVIVMADFDFGTWHGNWTNNVLLGIENRNAGYGGKITHDDDGSLLKNGKPVVLLGTRYWEQYTREQLAANVSLGRVVNAMFQIDPDLVLSHQCFWATKSDTGPCYPIHDVRAAIFSETPVDQLEWLGAYPMAPDENEDDDDRWYALGDGPRVEREFVRWEQPKGGQVVDDAWIARHLYALGFHAGPEIPSKEALKSMVRWFQRSTGAFKYGKMYRARDVLACDGVVGPLTKATLSKRVRTVGLFI